MQILYLNYAKVDKRYLRQLNEILAQAGYQLQTEVDLTAREQWRTELSQAIESSAGMIYALSLDAIASPWCQWEFEQAVKFSKPIVLVVIRPQTPIPDFFRQYPVLDFINQKDQLLQRLPSAAVTFPADSVNSTDWQPEGIPAQLTLQQPFLTYLQQNSAIVEFFGAYQKGDWRASLGLLKNLKEKNSSSSRLWDYYQRDVLVRLERERWLADIDGLYSRLQRIIETDPEKGRSALHSFWENYTGYDPSGLYDKYHPEFTPLSDEFESESIESIQTIPEPPLEVILASSASPNAIPVVVVNQSVPTSIAQPLSSKAQTNVALMLDLLERDSTSPEKRAEIGRELAALGDPRDGVGVRPDGIPDIDWVLIPAGDFIYQESKQMTLRHDFYMSRYTVTNAQFQAFLDDPNGFANDMWWNGLAARQGDPGKSRWDLPNHPREKVSWYDAMAFCRWLSSLVGIEIRLPTEKEWEKAARGIDGRMFPYGEHYRAAQANVADTGIKSTTAVGVFVNGASPYGVMDMSGNVWEWSLTDFDTGSHAYLATDTRRVLRGGAWNSIQRLSTAIAREADLPFERTSNRGFRLVYEAENL